MSAIRVDFAKPYFATSSLVIGYALCSSLLAVINKFAITKFNYPGLLTALQYFGSLGFGNVGIFAPQSLHMADGQDVFAHCALVFYLAIFINTNLLCHANLDTFVMCRSCTPLLVALADTAFRKLPIPSKLTFVSLLIILGGAIGYVATDLGFSSTGYSWAFAYLVTIATKMVYIKHMVTNVGLNARGFVLYNTLPIIYPLSEFAELSFAIPSWLDDKAPPVLDNGSCTTFMQQSHSPRECLVHKRV